MTNAKCQHCGGKSVTFLCGRHHHQLRDTLAQRSGMGHCMDILGLLATGQAYVYEQMKEGF